jgi:16S rRNA (guanine527-N7)-methyltransferase
MMASPDSESQHPPSKEIEDPPVLLAEGARALNLELTPQQVALFLLYLQELRRWSLRISLTAIREDREIIIKHFLDSLSYIKGFTPFPGMQMMDVGSGAGFPGIPLAIYDPGIRVTLVESSQKKSAFLKHVTRHLQLPNVTIVTERVEKHNKVASDQGNQDLIVARALSNTDQVACWSRPLLKSTGRLILSRGPDIHLELEAMHQYRALGGMYVQKILDVLLPFSSYQRHLIVLSPIRSWTTSC